MTPLVQCVPNFSEGRQADVIDEIVDAVRQTPHIRLADWSADPDHNRLVVTFVGPPDAVCAAAKASCAVAVARIDLREHQGVHPRLGALDVLPLVPLREITLTECAVWACRLGQELAHEQGLPIFFYEAATPVAQKPRPLPLVRKMAFHGLIPDAGPYLPHPTAGAVVVGARGPLIAYNVDLATTDLRIARTIARTLRDGGGAGFVGVRALGLRLESRGATQVSMNITRPQTTPLTAVFQYIVDVAERKGATVLGSEVVGALPGYAAFDIVADALQAAGLKPGQILLENWKVDGASDENTPNSLWGG